VGNAVSLGMLAADAKQRHPVFDGFHAFCDDLPTEAAGEATTPFAMARSSGSSRMFRTKDLSILSVRAGSRRT
jgi:hypothetical protein